MECTFFLYTNLLFKKKRHSIEITQNSSTILHSQLLKIPGEKKKVQIALKFIPYLKKLPFLKGNSAIKIKCFIFGSNNPMPMTNI